MSFKHLVVASLLVLLASSPVMAGMGPKKVSGTGVNWNFTQVVSSLEADMEYIVAPPVGTPVFHANQFTLVDSSNRATTVGYIGFQTDFNNAKQRRSMLFSIWNATDFATANPEGVCAHYTHEGSGNSCFIPYDWVQGHTYRVRIVKQDNFWYRGTVTDMTASPGVETEIGRIQAPQNNAEDPAAGTTAGIGGMLSQWVEWYGPRLGGCNHIVYTKVLRKAPTGNGGSYIFANAPSYGHNLDTDTPLRCQNLDTWSAGGNDSYQEQGNPGISAPIQLVASTGKFVYAQSTTGTEISGMYADIWPGQTWEGCGGKGFRADSTGGRDCSQITRVALPSGKVALQTDSGLYLSCANGGGSSVSATAYRAATNESFTETASNGKVYYQTATGKYLTASSTGELRCDGTVAGTNEGFIMLVNAADSAIVSVSSEVTDASGQTGLKAVDNFVGGYPLFVEREWAAPGENAGAWIQLNWVNAIPVSAITLYDRMNDYDRILAGSLIFSDGSTVPVGALPNEARQGLTVNFTPRTVSSVKFQVTQTAANGSTGLAEIQVWKGNAVPAWTCANHSATNDQHVAAGRATKTKTTSWWTTTYTYYAVGSNEKLGTSGTTTVALKQIPQGYYAKGTCPLPPTPPTFGATNYTTSGKTVTITVYRKNNRISLPVQFRPRLKIHPIAP